MKVEPSIEKDWLMWQKNEHIPAIMATNLFSEVRFYRLLEQDDSEGKTFVIQYLAKNLSHYQEYIERHAPALRDEAQKKWGDAIIGFRTVMESVQ